MDGLQQGQPLKMPFARQQFRMCPLLHNSSLLKNDNPMRVADG